LVVGEVGLADLTPVLRLGFVLGEERADRRLEAGIVTAVPV
jgi:hypothetical protein